MSKIEPREAVFIKKVGLYSGALFAHQLRFYTSYVPTEQKFNKTKD